MTVKLSNSITTWNMKMKYKERLVLLSLFLMNLVDDPAPEVTIVQGILSGKTSRCGTFYEYIGIPYAKSDNNTRFQAPLPPPSWKGVFKADEGFHMCPQETIFGIMGSEDCLKINVYVPTNPKTDKPLAVMVYIYGGAFVFGSGGKILYGPRFLVRKDVILVTFNYRVALLGFLCLRTKEAPGNAGIKDQIAALRWVKKNIAAFGGDPDNVTVFGESAGGVSLSLLIASEATNGLFNRAIIQSGSSVSNWSINRKPIWIASLIAKTMGYNTEDPKELYDIFMKMDYKDIIALKAKKPMDIFYDTGLIHLPCVEREIPGVEPVITDLPYNIYENGITKNIEVIQGTASNEGIFLAGTESEEMLKSRNERYLFASDLRFSSEEEAMVVAKRVQKFYFGDDEISTKKLLNVSKLYSQLYFEIPMIFETELLSRSNIKVYNYIFNYNGWRNVLKWTSGFWNEEGATHGDDLFYLWDGDVFPKALTQEDRRMVYEITSMWTNFAKYGDPTPEWSNLPFRWKPSTKENLQFLYIDRESKMGPMPSPEGYRLWKDVYSKYRNTEIM